MIKIVLHIWVSSNDSKRSVHPPAGHVLILKLLRFVSGTVGTFTRCVLGVGRVVSAETLRLARQEGTTGLTTLSTPSTLPKKNHTVHDLQRKARHDSP